MTVTVRHEVHPLKAEGRGIALTYITKGTSTWRVSTVCLHSKKAKDLLIKKKGQSFADAVYGDQEYETMVFLDGDSYDLDMVRYWTQAQAEVGHETMVQQWVNKLSEQGKED